MGHYIPTEELEKFLKKCNPAERAQAAADAVSDRIGEGNKGFAMLAKMGWTEGAGLGAGGAGMVNPVNAGEVKQNNLGVGAGETSEVKEEDDIYEQYKKRMMLGYKHRPNPLGNPRKAYY
uniref:G-patch domain-containing protein n=1 Tax=Pyramimonas obovata TaxID=1411642 RepID=A0A7S0N2U6_9CHLO|mmetsp:Transcript_17701/g.38617  ORF Transcript_17701/g.38617 Transcript_17701/m.38617 type:complete len:120 (+) Transcript_17701:180-539(+)